MNPTKKWPDATWNPVTGCTPISEGCAHCYAMRGAPRQRGRHGYPADEPFRVTLHPDRLREPFDGRKPRRIFVCSVSDLFHQQVPDYFRFAVWHTIAHCPQHTFMVLTKRPEAAAEWFARLADAGPDDAPPAMWRGGRHASLCSHEQADAVRKSGRAQMFHDWVATWGAPPPGCAAPLYDWAEGPRWWPTELPNLWIGTTIEDATVMRTRLEHLYRCPAVVRFVSYEPALGPLDPSQYLGLEWADIAGCWIDNREWFLSGQRRGFDWLILGCETGPRPRPAQPEWFVGVISQAKAAGLPVFVKSFPLPDGPSKDPARWPIWARLRQFPGQP